MSAAEPGRPLRVCFVCSGNICRSPTAEVVFRAMLADAGITGIEVDSAGTGDWHAGDDMDVRARNTLVRHGYLAERHVARQFTVADFADRDLVVAIDQGHVSRLAQLAHLADDPEQARDCLVLLRSYDPDAVAIGDLDVPDPYYEEAEGFELVLGQVERACAGLLSALRTNLPANGAPKGVPTRLATGCRQGRAGVTQIR
jgi:protein-tyrosine phosphatase